MSWAKTTELRIDPTTSSRAHIIFRDIVPSLLSVTSGSSRLAGERAYCETPKKRMDSTWSDLSGQAQNDSLGKTQAETCRTRGTITAGVGLLRERPSQMLLRVG